MLVNKTLLQSVQWAAQIVNLCEWQLLNEVSNGLQCKEYRQIFWSRTTSINHSLITPFIVKLEKLAVGFFLAPAEGCSLSLQGLRPSVKHWNPSGPATNVENSFWKLCRNLFKFFCGYHFFKFCGNPFGNYFLKSVWKTLWKSILKFWRSLFKFFLELHLENFAENR